MLYKILTILTTKLSTLTTKLATLTTKQPVGEFIAIPLSIIFSKSFNSGTLPHDWKNA